MTAVADPSALDRLGLALSAVTPRFAPHPVTEWVEALSPVMRASGITTPKRVAMFVGQVAAESGGFSLLSENLNYSVGRLSVVWPGHFPVGSPNCERCALNPEVLANTVYADRLGNGPESSGDGWTFRGAGLIQLTGRANHTAFAKSIGMDPVDCAAWLRTPRGAAASACWFWSSHGLNALADAGDVEGATRKINGGTNGLDARRANVAAALHCMPVPT